LDKKDFFLICNPDIVGIIKLRALGCTVLVLPHMKKSSQISEIHEMGNYILNQYELVRMNLVDPGKILNSIQIDNDGIEYSDCVRLIIEVRSWKTLLLMK